MDCADVARVLGFGEPRSGPRPRYANRDAKSYILDNVIKPLIESIWYKEADVVLGERDIGAWGGDI